MSWKDNLKKYSIPSMALVDLMKYTTDLAEYSMNGSMDTEEKLQRLRDFAKKVLDEIELLKRSGME